MTDRLPIGWLSFGAFVVVLGFLALQLRDGHDPALGAANAPVPKTRRVLVRRIVRRVVVVHVISAPTAAAAPSAPVVSTATPAAAPVPSPSPAPVSRSS